MRLYPLWASTCGAYIYSPGDFLPIGHGHCCKPRFRKSKGSEFSEPYPKNYLSYALKEIALTLKRLRDDAGLMGRCCNAISEEDVNIEMISQGAAKGSISIVVAQGEVEKAARALHHLLFENEDEDDGSEVSRTIAGRRRESYGSSR